jgi:soluble lytic murein transglycosylase
VRLSYLLALGLGIPALSYGASKSSHFNLGEKVAAVGGVRLSNVMHDRDLNGLTSEASTDRIILEQQTLQYIQFREKKGSVQKLEKIAQDCEQFTQELGNPFCNLILNPVSRRTYEVHAPFVSRRQKLQNARVLVQGFKKANIETLKSASESDLLRALKHFPSFHSVSPLINKVLGEKECVSSALLVALGLKVEDQFPQEQIKTLAYSLYSKGLECSAQEAGVQDTAQVQARYRMGLMQIWDGHCDQAEALLSKIIDAPNSADYKMRAAYWRYYCADQSKNEALKLSLRTWLTAEFPFSLHSLLVQTDNKFGNTSSNSETDPPVIFRSRQVPEMNSLTRAVEALLAQNETGLASELLVTHLNKMATAEPAFQLYWAVLLKRAQEELGSFQFIATLLKLNPGFISKSTLSMIYPLQHFEVIREFDQSLDPYLLISLIRQESAFVKNAKSSGGAYGLMQLQLPTARNFERVSRKQLYDPKTNIRIGVKYFRRLLDRYKGDVQLSLAAYNAGPARIDGWSRRYPVQNPLLFLDILPIRETREYVSSIARNYYWYLSLYSSKDPSRGVAAQGSHLMQSFMLVPGFE